MGAIGLRDLVVRVSDFWAVWRNSRFPEGGGSLGLFSFEAVIVEETEACLAKHPIFFDFGHLHFITCRMALQHPLQQMLRRRLRRSTFKTTWHHGAMSCIVAVAQFFRIAIACTCVCVIVYMYIYIHIYT